LPIWELIVYLQGMAKAVKVKDGKGRLTDYSKELADEICELIATTDRGLHSICKEFNVSVVSVFNWLKDPRYEYFLNNYTRAKEAQAELMAGEIVSIADKPLIGEVIKETKDGTFTETGDNVQRSRLMVESRKWVASKLLPKKYGDKVDVTSGGEAIKQPVYIVKDQEQKDELDKL